jgi:hypothetical protein
MGHVVKPLTPIVMNLISSVRAGMLGFALTTGSALLVPTVYLHAQAEVTYVHSKGSPVPGAGESYVQEGAVWTALGSTAINSQGSVAFTGRWFAPRYLETPIQTGSGIFVSTSTGDSENEEATLVARVGQVVPGIEDDAVFSGFRDPVINAAGDVVFLATIRPAPGSDAADLPPNQRTVVCYVSSGDLDSVQILAQTGTEISSGGPLLKSVAALDVLPEGPVIARGFLGGPGVTSANDAVVLAFDGGDSTILLRDGQAVPNAATPAAPLTLVSFSTLVGGPGAPGFGRGWVVDDEGTFKLRASAVVSNTTLNTRYTQYLEVAFPTTGQPATLVATGPVSIGAPAQPANARFKVLGIPSFSWGATNQGSFRGVFLSGATSIFDLVAGQAVAIQGAGEAFDDSDSIVISSVKDPVCSPDGTQRVWEATLRSSEQGEVDGTNNRVLFIKQGDSDPIAIARTGGDDAPGAEAPFKRFISIVAVDGTGAVFTAQLQDGKIGLWALADGSGSPELLLLQGQGFDADPLKDQIVRSFTVLHPSSAQGVTRSVASTSEGTEIAVNVISRDVDTGSPSSNIVKFTLGGAVVPPPVLP